MHFCQIRGIFFGGSNAIRSLFSRASLSWLLGLAVFLTACGGTDPTPVALSITTHPADQSVVVGSPAEFAVVAAGAGTLTYQWHRNGIDITGAQSDSYTLPAATLADSGATFSVQVSDDNTSVTSTAAALTVTPVSVAPGIVVPPASTSAVVGEAINFTVTASGTSPLAYQWQRDGTNLVGETSSTLNWTAALADNGAQFGVLVSNAAGSVTSASATLAVTAAPVAPTITTQPSSVTVTAPAPASFTVVPAGTPPLSYQWQRDDVDIVDANADSYTTPATVLTDSGSKYTVIVTNASGSVTSSAATLSVLANAVAPTITTQPMAQSVEQGQQASFSVVAAGTAPFSYQWQRNSTNITDANAASYTTPVLTQAADDGALYRVIVTNSVASVTSDAVAVSVTQTLLACSGGAQAGWCWVEPKPHGNPVRDVQYLGGDVFVASGGGGSLMRSTDGGATWSVTFAIGSSVNAMHFVDASVGYAVGDFGFIARTDDGGQTWTPQTSSVQTALNDVHFFDANLGLAVGDSNTMLRSTDGGATWTKVTVTAFGHAYGVRFADANIAVAVGSNAARLHSTDGGASWTRIDTPATCYSYGSCDLLGVTFTSATIGFAVGNRSNPLLRTDDAGLTWETVPGASAAGASDGSCGFGAIDFSGDNGIAAATCGWVAHTSDGGVTWTKFPAGGLKLGTNTYGVAFGTGAVAVAVGGEGQIYRTTNAGVSWTSVFPQRDGQDMWNVYFDNASTAYIMGTKSYKSTDGGLSWAQDTSLPSGMRARASVNWAVLTAGPNYSINRSTDGGLTWSNVYFQLGGSTLDSFYFYNSLLGYAYGKTAGGTLRTTDGGLTWAPLGLGTAVGVHFFGDLVGVFVGSGRIYSTVNGGANWKEVVNSQWRLAGAAFTGSSGVAVGFNGTMYSTSNQGLTWTQITGVTENFRGVQSTASGSSYIAYTESGRMLRSADGSSWSPMASPVGGQINAIRYYDDSLGLAVGSPGIILRTTTGGQ